MIKRIILFLSKFLDPDDGPVYIYSLQGFEDNRVQRVDIPLSHVLKIAREGDTEVLVSAKVNDYITIRLVP